MNGSDVELLDRWRGGDSNAGQELVGRYFGRVRSYFMTKSPLHYEDLVSNTFLRLTEKLDAFKGDGSFRAFLFGIARMILLEHFRKLQQDNRFDPLNSSVLDLAVGGASSVLGAKEHHRLLFDALRSLVLADQELLELYYWQGLSGREIAEVRDCAESKVRWFLRRAIKRLGEAYDKLEAKPHEREYGPEMIEAWMRDLREQLDDLKPE